MSSSVPDRSRLRQSDALEDTSESTHGRLAPACTGKMVWPIWKSISFQRSWSRRALCGPCRWRYQAVPGLPHLVHLVYNSLPNIPNFVSRQYYYVPELSILSSSKIEEDWKGIAPAQITMRPCTLRKACRCIAWSFLECASVQMSVHPEAAYYGIRQLANLVNLANNFPILFPRWKKCARSFGYRSGRPGIWLRN